VSAQPLAMRSSLIQIVTEGIAMSLMKNHKIQIPNPKKIPNLNQQIPNKKTKSDPRIDREGTFSISSHIRAQPPAVAG
jgi:hypothetical protein